MELLLDICSLWAWGTVQGGKHSQLAETSLSKMKSITHRLCPYCIQPFSFPRRPPTLPWVQLWLVLADFAVRSRASARWLPRSQPCSAAVGSWERWGQGPVLGFGFVR